jgi:acyl-CoA dehydrogenase
MNFDFSDDEKQLKTQARRFLEKECSLRNVRALIEAGESFDRGLWNELGAMGFLGAAVPEEYGGSGAGHLALCVVAEELGRVLAPVPALSSIYLTAEIIVAEGSKPQKDRYLPKLASGELVGTVAMYEGSGRVAQQPLACTVSGGKLSGTKVLVPDGMIADLALVCANDADSKSRDGLSQSLYLVDLAQQGVRRTPQRGLDLAAGQARIAFTYAPAERVGVAGEGWRILANAMDGAAVLTAFEQLGGADRALEMATSYALERYAFGRVIGSFQAIKHMLADMYVSATLSRSNCYFGAWALATKDSSLAVAAATARVSATQAYQHCAKNNIQVHGGMGFTWESDCHLYYRRAARLGLILGGAREWEDLLITRMLQKNETVTVGG